MDPREVARSDHRLRDEAIQIFTGLLRPSLRFGLTMTTFALL